MTSSSSAIPAPAVRGVASGVLFMAFFGTLWAGIGVGGLQGLGDPWVPIGAVLIGIILLGAGVRLFFAARRLPEQVGPDDATRGRRIGRWFGLVFATEGILIFLASVICNALGRFDLFFPTMALIVGVHFFPLAALFEVRLYYLVGTLLCALALLTLTVVPQAAAPGGYAINAQWAVLGFGAALILWGVGLWLWRTGSGLLARATAGRA